MGRQADDRRGLVRQHCALLLHKHVTDLLFREKQNETKHICICVLHVNIT